MRDIGRLAVLAMCCLLATLTLAAPAGPAATSSSPASIRASGATTCRQTTGATPRVPAGTDELRIDFVLLSGQRATPVKAQQLGFTFTYPLLSLALDAVLQAERFERGLVLDRDPVRVERPGQHRRRQAAGERWRGAVRSDAGQDRRRPGQPA